MLKKDSKPVISYFLYILRAHKTNKVDRLPLFKAHVHPRKTIRSWKHIHTQKLAGFSLLRVPGKSGSVSAPPSPPCGFNPNCAIQTWRCGEGGGEGGVGGGRIDLWTLRGFCLQSPVIKEFLELMKTECRDFRGVYFNNKILSQS